MKRRHICSPKTIFYHIDSFSPGVDPMTYIVTCHSYTSKKDKIVIYRWSLEYFPVTSFQTTSIHHLLVQVVSYWQNWGKCRMCLKGNVSFAIVGSARRLPAVKGPFGRLATIRGSKVAFPDLSLIANVNQVLKQRASSYKFHFWVKSIFWRFIFWKSIFSISIFLNVSSR